MATQEGSTIAVAGDSHPMRDHLLSVIKRGVHDYHALLDATHTVEDIANPCDRCVAMKLAAMPQRPRSATWDGWVEVVDAAFTHQITQWVSELSDEWQVRDDLSVLQVGGEGGPEVQGARGLYRESDGFVMCVKGASKRDLKQSARSGLGAAAALEAQIHGYAWQHAGFKVSKVAVAALPRDGYLEDTVVQQWDFDPGLALSALGRYVALLEVDNPDTVPLLRGCPRCPARRAEGSVVEMGSLDPASSPVGFAHSISLIPGTISTDSASCEARDWLIGFIDHSTHNRPRNLQKRIGPSEIGDPCTRCLARKVAGEEAARGDDPWEDGWKAEVGTAIHALCESYFTRYGGEGWHLEESVCAAPIAGVLVRGTCDAYHDVAGAVVDFKTTGESGLAQRRRDGHSTVYKRQGHIYGLGWAIKGYEVRTVGLLSIPRDGVLERSIYQEFPFSAKIAFESIQRADHLARAGASFTTPEDRDAWLETLETYDDCFSCGRFDPRMRKKSWAGSR